VTDPLKHGFVDVPADIDSEWWWTALANQKLLLPCCDGCRRFFFPPQPTCPYCGSIEWRRVESAGVGHVYSWVVIHVPLNPAFVDDTPYTIVAVELDEGVRLLGRLRQETALAAGMRMTSIFYEVGDKTLLGFEPSS